MNELVALYTTQRSFTTLEFNAVLGTKREISLKAAHIFPVVILNESPCTLINFGLDLISKRN